MCDAPKLAANTPPCPLCASKMSLKQVHRQIPLNHYVFKCETCGLEYPVIGPAATKA